MDSPPRFKLSLLSWIGLGILLVGIGPVVIFAIVDGLGLLSDPNPNPIGLVLIAIFSFWPGVILMVVGLIVSLVRYTTQRRGR